MAGNSEMRFQSWSLSYGHGESYTADVGKLAASLGFIITFLCRRLATLHVGPSFIRWTAAAQDGAGRRADQRVDAFQQTLS